MPQLEQIASTYASQLLWLLLTFAILYFGIGQFTLPRVGRVVEERRARIAADLATAEQAQQQASALEGQRAQVLEEARRKAQTLVAGSSNQAARDLTARLAGLAGELETRAADAEQRLRAARDSALAELDRIAAEAAGEIVTRLTGASPSPDAIERALVEARQARAL